MGIAPTYLTGGVRATLTLLKFLLRGSVTSKLSFELLFTKKCTYNTCYEYLLHSQYTYENMQGQTKHKTTSNTSLNYLQTTKISFKSHKLTH